LPGNDHTVIAFDDNRDLIPKSLNAGVGHDEPASPRELQAKVFILGVTIPLPCRGFEDMGRRRPAGRNAPSAPLMEERRFRLRARQTELAGIGGGPPRGVIRPQDTEAFGEIVFREPLDFARGGLGAERFQSLRSDKLDSAGAVFPDIGNQAKWVVRRDLESPSPVFEYPFVVGQQPPKKWLDSRMAVLSGRKRHRERKRI
jgi:hypothetical protein